MQGSDVANGQLPHIFVARPQQGACDLPNASFFTSPLQTGERDLMANRMRLAAFSITSSSVAGVYQVRLRVVTGENDLLCSPKANDCSDPDDSQHLDNDDLTCKSPSGSTYCATSELSTAVTQRLSS
jgi:hypothetical protein